MHILISYSKRWIFQHQNRCFPRDCVFQPPWPSPNELLAQPVHLASVVKVQGAEIIPRSNSVETSSGLIRISLLKMASFKVHVMIRHHHHHHHHHCHHPQCDTSRVSIPFRVTPLFSNPACWHGTAQQAPDPGCFVCFCHIIGRESFGRCMAHGIQILTGWWLNPPI